MNITFAGNHQRQHVYDIRPEFDNNDAIFNAAHYDISAPVPNKAFSRKNYYKIWLVHDNCDLHFADRSIYVTGPALIFSNPVIPYACEGLGYHRSGYWCIFREEFLKTNDRVKSLQESPLFDIYADNVFSLDEQQLPIVTMLFENILSSMETDYRYKFEEIRNYVNLLIHQGLKLQPLKAHTEAKGSARLAGLFLELLEEQFPIRSLHYPLELKTPGDFASRLGIHVNHLNHAIKAITGKTTRDLIAEKVLYETKGLLKHTNWDISEIAFALGFSYSNHLNNFFKRHTGTTPSAFRTDI